VVPTLYEEIGRASKGKDLVLVWDFQADCGYGYVNGGLQC
jgi:hypothetical protein